MKPNERSAVDDLTSDHLKHDSPIKIRQERKTTVG